MELNFPIIAIPAAVALIFKAAIFVYARYSGTHNLQTRLYLFFLFFFSVQNISEISGFYVLNVKGVMPYAEANLFYASAIAGMAFLFHLSASFAFEGQHGLRKVLPVFIYLWGIALEILLLFTKWLIKDFETLSYPVGLSLTRVPGPIYFLFALYAIGIFASVIGMSLYGWKKQDTAKKQLKNFMLIVAIAPMALLVFLVLGLLHFGIKWMNWSLTFPFAITYFLLITAYTTYQHRLLDIQFFIPWSKVRARKTAFYDRIRAMIAEIADLGSVREAVHRLADTLGCSVALVSAGKPVLAVAGGAQQMVSFPLEQLRNIDRIVVANEIADSSPETYRIMRSHGVAAVVPFYPHSQNASGWMLLGDAFSEQVYTPLDFKMVEQLFDKMAELFLDKLLLMRGQLAAAERRLQTMEFRLQEAETGIAALRSENETLQQSNLRLTREQAADSLLVAGAPRGEMLPNIVLLGRDKPLLKRLRRFFPQADQFVGPDSTSFRRQSLPDVLVCRVDADKDAQWLAFITQLHGRAALLFHGDGTHEFIAAHIDALAGTLVEIMPEGATDEAIVRRIEALAGLRRAVCAVTDPNCPLIGISQIFHDAMRDAARLAGFAEPVLIESRDTTECAAVARYLHNTGRHTGHFQIASAACALEQRVELFAACQNGTLLLTDVDALEDEPRERLLVEIKNAAGVRVVLTAATVDDALRKRFRSFWLRLATLRERRLDLPLLVHYFTLQYNLRAGTQAYLTQTELDNLMAAQYPENLAALKAAMFDRLNAKHQGSASEPEMELSLTDKTLDDHVAAFEARLIEQTLQRCQGNKSKAARLLGLRPNTLHYKIERYGLGDSKGKSGDR